MNSLKQLQESFFKNGWCIVDPKSIDITDKTIKKLKSIERKDYILNKKNLGNLSLDQKAIKKYDVFKELSENYKMKHLIENITGRNLEISCFMQMLSIGQTNSLQWHRDSYISKNKCIGPIPNVIKIMLINNPIKKKDGPFEVISGSHKIDINNRLFDLIIPKILFNKRKTFNSGVNQCILFDGKLLHKRSASRKDGFRLVTIISMESPLK
tara:strand:+ start:27 stop:659 length:633 start_codon:yes stop_codon:yes gene_type:complete